LVAAETVAYPREGVCHAMHVGAAADSTLEAIRTMPEEVTLL
jgi:hypothetical protein